MNRQFDWDNSVDQDDWPNKRIGGWAPGDYTCICSTCGCSFIGDKRASVCYPCAVEVEKTERESYIKKARRMPWGSLKDFAMYVYDMERNYQERKVVDVAEDELYPEYDPAITEALEDLEFYRGIVFMLLRRYGKRTPMCDHIMNEGR